MSNTSTPSTYPVWTVLSLSWIVIVVALYCSFNTEYFDALSLSPYIGGALIGVIAFIGGAALLNQMASKLMNGLFIWFSSLLIITPLMLQFDQADQLVRLDGGEWVQLYGSYLFLCLELLVFVLAGYSIGDRLLGRIFPDIDSTFKKYWSIAIGFWVLTTLGMALAAMSALNQWSVLALILLAVGQNPLHSIHFLKDLLWSPLSEKLPLKKILTRAGLLSILVLTVSVNLVYNLKAFPIGWDALSYYLNVTQQIVETGALPQGYQAYNASLFASMAALLFNNTAAALGLLVLGGILSTGLIYSWIKKYTSTTMALVGAVWFYTLPNIVYLSTKDIKIDLFLLFILLSTLSFFIHLVQKDRTNRNGWITIGVLCAYAVGIKYTSLFFITALLCAYVYKLRGYKMATVVLVAICGFYMLSNIASISGVGTKYAGARILGATLMAIGVSYLLWDAYQNKKLAQLIKYPIILGFAFLLAFSPWLLKNGIEQGQAHGIRLLFGKGEEPRLDMKKINEGPSSPESVFMQFIETEDDIDPNSASSKREEIQRYLGYERGALKFITLPADLAFNFNLKAPFVHIGFLFLLLLPILLTMNRKEKKKNVFVLSYFLLTISLIGLSIISFMAYNMGQPDTSIPGLIAQFNAQSEDAGMIMSLVAYLGLPLAYLFMIPGISSGALAYPIGIGAVILGALLIRQKTEHWTSDKRTFLWASYSFATLWWLFAGGIIWYGYLMLATMVILLTSYLPKLREESRLIGTAVYGCFGLWIALALILRLAALDPSSERTAHNLWVSPMVNYATGAWDKDETLSKLSPVIAAALPTINAETDSRIYRVGTFMPYFIKENNNRIYTDNQLDGFSDIAQLFDTREGIAQTLYRDGFRYIIVDLNTAAIDKTPDASLQAKFKNFMNFLFQNNQLELMGTDRMIIVEQNGQRKQVPGLLGREYAHPGSIAIFKIKP